LTKGRVAVPVYAGREVCVALDVRSFWHELCFEWN